jgi:hypothetical protein
MSVPNPTYILRFIHVDNLNIYLRRGGLHAPNFTPEDGLEYKTIHNVDVQAKRRHQPIPCGPKGVIHDYVPFYFGPLSPMMLNLNTGRVAGYTEGQEPLIYLVSSCQLVEQAGVPFVFSNGHGIAAFTDWYGELTDLDKVDWEVVGQRYWTDNVNDMDRQRRKQAEFLIYRFCPWALIHSIVVIDAARKAQVEQILGGFSEDVRRVVTAKRDWYYW